MKKRVTNDVENSANAQVQKANHLAQFFQTLCMLFLTMVVCGLLLLDHPVRRAVWIVICLIAAIVWFRIAIYYGLKAVKIYRLTVFEISAERLETLRVIKIPDDVFNRIDDFQKRRYIGEGRFFNMLADAVGTERCAEVRNQIFKYTKVE